MIKSLTKKLLIATVLGAFAIPATTFSAWSHEHEGKAEHKEHKEKKEKGKKHKKAKKHKEHKAKEGKEATASAAPVAEPAQAEPAVVQEEPVK